MRRDWLGQTWLALVVLLAVSAEIAFVAAVPRPAIAQTSSASSDSRREFLQKLAAAAIERTNHAVRYLGSYVRIDLQKDVHEDMLRNFAAYPNQRLWGLAHPDSNIDHRRVPNLMAFFGRKGETLAITSRAEDYSPGDLVTWDLGGGVPHIGIVVDRKSPPSGRYLVVHNIGAGPKMEDVLFHWKITGHYRYFGPSSPER